MLNLDEPSRNQEILIISFFISSDLGVESKFFFQFFVDVLPLGSGSVDPHIFTDPGNQNLADLTDPDPKHWFILHKRNKHWQKNPR